MGIILTHCSLCVFTIHTKHILVCVCDMLCTLDRYDIPMSVYCPPIVNTPIVWSQICVLIPYSTLVSGVLNFVEIVSDCNPLQTGFRHIESH